MAKKKEKRYYIVYGSNLNIDQMAHRCPNAVVIGSAVLSNYRLLFRGTPGNTHATVEKALGYSVPVLVWKITATDEAALDVYEGVPSYYYKDYVNLKIGEEIKQAMLYVMSAGRKLGTPSSHYYNVIKSGFETAGFDIRILETALNESCDSKSF